MTMSFPTNLGLLQPAFVWAGAAVWACCLILAACGPSKEEIVAAKVAERMADFRKKESLKCRMSLLQDAENIADSLLLEEAKALLADSLASNRPFRPVKPAPLPALDSSPIAPIFKSAPKTQKQR